MSSKTKKRIRWRHLNHTARKPYYFFAAFAAGAFLAGALGAALAAGFAAVLAGAFAAVLGAAAFAFVAGFAAGVAFVAVLAKSLDLQNFPYCAW